MVPDPKIVAAAMKACRRLNDYALAVRYLESVKVHNHITLSLYYYIYIYIILLRVVSRFQ